MADKDITKSSSIGDDYLDFKDTVMKLAEIGYKDLSGLFLDEYYVKKHDSYGNFVNVLYAERY